MPPSLLAPPTRREVTLALFGLCVFVLAYNIDSSARAPTSGQPDFLSAKADPNLYTDAALVLEHDGRRPPGWRDALEEQIMGSWAWSAGSVADGIGRPPEGEGSRYMEHAIWGPRMQQALNYHGAAAGMKPGVGPAKQDDGVFRWGKNGLETKVLKHIPGYTVLENVVFSEGVLYMVSDWPQDLPPVEDIASSSENLDSAPRDTDWKIISKTQAEDMFRGAVSLIQGTSFIATGPSSYQDSHTLLALWRLYSSLDPDISVNGSTTLSTPLRLVFPHIPRYTAKSMDPFPKVALYPALSFTGFHPQLAKAAFPAAGLQHFEEWDDIAGMPTPFMFERIVLADRGAASRTHFADGSADPEWAGPFLDLEASDNWIAPLRAAIAGHVGASDIDHAGGWWKRGEERPVVVYISKQLDAQGPKLKADDHKKLVAALRRMSGPEVIIVDAKMPWHERMRAIVRATIVLGVTGDTLADAYFMRPSLRATLMEFFPPDVFMRDMEIPMDSLGVQYIAWQGNRKFTVEELPEVAFPENYSAWTNLAISIDVNAVIKSVQEELAQKE